MFKKFLLVCLISFVTVFAVPQNKSFQQQSSWNGWGGLVDWSFRSLRIGVANEDSLMENGWLIADSSSFGYLLVDSLNLDSLYVLFISAPHGNIDSLVTDSIYVGGNLNVEGVAILDSSLSVADSSWFSDDLWVGFDFSALYGTFRNSLGVDTVLWVGDSTSMYQDSSYFSGNVAVDNILFSDSISAVHTSIRMLDSLLTIYIGATGNISATNNVSANDVVASDSLSGNTIAAGLTVKAGSSVSAHSASISMDRIITRNSYMYAFGTPFGAVFYGGALMLIGHPGVAASVPTHLISDVMTGLFFLNQNPDFAAAAGWVLSGTTISGSKLNKLTAAGVGTATSTAISNYPILATTQYLLHVDVDSLSAGDTVLVQMGGATFANLAAEGSDQWFRVTTVNNSGLFSITWDDTETGILDDVYVYRLAGDFVVGGEFWNQSWSVHADYTVLEGDHVITMNESDTTIISLPELAASWNPLTSTGREIIIENQGSGFCVVSTNLSDDALNALMGRDTIRVTQYETVVLRAVTQTHWAVQR